MAKTLPPRYYPSMSSPNFSNYNLQLNGQPLTRDQQRTFRERYQQLQEGNCRLIYRGDRKTASVKKYGLTVQAIPHEFNDMLFLFGPKGRYFLGKVNQTAQNLPERFGIADASDAFFRAIFDMLRDLFVSRRFSPGVQGRIDTFKEREPYVSQFFSFVKNRKALIQAVKGLKERERIRIRDYYLTLLHHLGQSQYYPVSFLLSATWSFKVAEQFSEQAKKDGDEIIFFGWVPWGNDTILHTFRFSGRDKPDLLTLVGLPRYRRSFFPKQEEITLKGGLLPHYLFGYLHTKEDRLTFEVNPYVFQITNDDWIKNGLPVDQAAFWTQLPNTAFKAAFILNPDNRDFSDLM